MEATPSARRCSRRFSTSVSRREYRDYIGAEQAVMATELLMLDLDTARNRPRLDALFKLVEDDEAYRPNRSSRPSTSCARRWDSHHLSRHPPAHCDRRCRPFRLA